MLSAVNLSTSVPILADTTRLFVNYVGLQAVVVVQPTMVEGAVQAA
jgi:hypothetical protein